MASLPRPLLLALALAALLCALAAAGCSSSGSGAGGGAAAPPGPKESLPASSDASYDYRVATDKCNCLEYSVRDTPAKIEYRFRASYRMQTGVLTEVLFTIVNQSDDTLSFDRSAVKVSSLNVRYQYNNKFLPLPWEPIPPRSSGTRKLTGKEVTTESNWHKIAGEQLTITIKGASLSGRELKSQTVVFVPENPNMGK